MALSWNILFMRLLGIDYGSRRVGVALGDTETKIASPWTVITSDERLDVLRRIHDIVDRERIDAVVVGIPRPLRGGDEENRQIRETRSFISDLVTQGLIVHEADEALTSKMASAQMAERGEKGKRDDLAAANILQSWLDRSRLLPL